MMGSVGHSGDMMRPNMDVDRPMGPGKKMGAIGHQAKAAVTAAREAGVELPKNAQGMAASGLARGVDAEMLFASLVTDDPVVDDPAATGDTAVPDDPVVAEGPVSDEAIVTPDEPEQTDMTAAKPEVPVQDLPPELSSVDTALELLMAARDEE